MVVNGRPVPLICGSGVAINPWEPHFFRPAFCGGKTVVLVLYIDPAWNLQASGQMLGPLNFGRAEIEVDTYLRMRKLDLVNGMIDPHADVDLIEDAFRGLAAGSLEQSWQWNSTNGSDVLRQSKGVDFRIRKSLRVLADIEFGEVSLDSVSEMIGLSRAHFFRMFRDQIGVTPNVYLNALRMEKAIDRLLMTSDTVADIGHDLGFSSQASFTRFFTTNGVLAPSDYRRSVVCSSAH
jgi:AraC-like DNA-binding protein